MGSRTFGYMRVSSRDQNEDRQERDLLGFGVPGKNIYMDKLSGKDFNRPAYQLLVHERMRPGDLLVVKSIDRLGRNYREILREWKFITEERKADIKILDMPLLDTRGRKDLLGTLISDIVLQLLSFVAENERDNIRQRQAEGISAARSRGVVFGRPTLSMPENFLLLLEQVEKRELSVAAAAEAIGCSRSTFYSRWRRHRGGRIEAGEEAGNEAPGPGGAQ